MSGAGAIARRAPATWAARPPRDLTVPIRVAAFAALAAYVSAAWLGMLIDPPVGRTVIVVATMSTAAAVLSLLPGSRLPRPAAHGLAAVVVIGATAIGLMAIGLPVRLIVPWHWGELATNLGQGLDGLWSIDYPYGGSAGWTRLVVLLALPATLGLATAMAFWPVRRRRAGLRTSALVVTLIAYCTATTTAPPSDPALRGLGLLLLIWAWLWLPGQDRRRGLLGGTLILAVGLVALPVAGALEGRPWVDYRSWGVSAPVGPTEAFTWDQSYGPLTWPRDGRGMLHVQSDGPHYWRAATLDDFDGTSWVQSRSPEIDTPQLPARAPGASGPRLNPDWVHDLTFVIDGLRSDLVVAAGTPLEPPRIDGLTVMERGMLLPTDRTLGDGDAYEVRSYIPEPTPVQMRRAPARYSAALAPEVELSLPAGRTITPPFWGTPAAGAPDSALAGSAYGGVYELARRITARQSTPYGAVKAIETYLGEHYRYSEYAPIDRLALRKFILGARYGYCQHFSGAMALMLRMVGIPARVAAGFSPGRAESGGRYVVTDFDSHSWVEVFFNGIGWVSFDPTPSAAPAQSRISGLGAPVGALALPAGDAANRPRQTSRSVESASRRGPGKAASDLLATSPWIWGGLLAALIGGAIARAHRRRRGAVVDGPDALLQEIESAVARVRSWDVRGSTLLGLERRLEADAGPGAAAYVAKLRAMRYGGDGRPPPAVRERGILRRELPSGLGLRGRIRALAAIPPWGPAHRACKPPFRSAS